VVKQEPGRIVVLFNPKHDWADVFGHHCHRAGGVTDHRLEHRLKLATLSAGRKLVLSWAKHKQRIDLHCAKEKSAKSESWKCSDINTEWEENYGDDKTHRAQDGTHC
jgi:hypothetical protein